MTELLRRLSSCFDGMILEIFRVKKLTRREKIFEDFWVKGEKRRHDAEKKFGKNF